MTNDESQIEYRRDPKPGTVVRVPLPEGTFAYGCQTTKVVLWLYSFVTDAPSCDRTLFSPSNWRWPEASFSLLPDVATYVRLNCPRLSLRGRQLGIPAIASPADWVAMYINSMIQPAAGMSKGTSRKKRQRTITSRSAWKVRI